MRQSDESITIQQLSDIFYRFSEDRNWTIGYNPSFLSKSIVIEAAELLEHFQKEDGELAKRKLKDIKIKKEVTDEMVDVLYYLMMLFRILEIDIAAASDAKLAELSKRYPTKA